MTDIVLDASVVLKWFAREVEPDVEVALSIRRAFDLDEIAAFAPPFIQLEVLNVAGRRWRWTDTELLDLVATVDRLRLVLQQPGLDSVAKWVTRGLTAYDASYVALAEETGLMLVTEDAQILDVAAAIAVPLATYAL